MLLIKNIYIFSLHFFYLFKIFGRRNDENFTQAMLYAQQGKQIPDKYYHNPRLQNAEGNTVAMIFAKKGIIPPRKWMHNLQIRNNNNETLETCLQEVGLPVPQNWKKPRLTIFDKACFKMYVPKDKHASDEQNKDGFTIAMIFAQRGIFPPNSWSHDPNIQNIHGDTVALLLAQRGVQIPKKWRHSPTLRNKLNRTVAMNLSLMKVKVPPEWFHDPTLKDVNEQTVSFILSRKGVVPPVRWEHDPNMLDIKHCSVAMHLARNYIIPPRQWVHDPTLQDSYKMTVAMQLANSEIVAPDEWYHENTMQNIEGMTVAMFMAKNHLYVPNEWQHDPSIQNKYGLTVAMIYAKTQMYPPQLWDHDPTLYSKSGKTTAIYLLSSGLVPPKRWLYNPTLKLKNVDLSLTNISIKSGIPVPYYAAKLFTRRRDIKKLQELYRKNEIPVPKYQKRKSPTIFEEAMANEVPDPDDHDPTEQDEDGWTVGMILASLGHIPPKEWMHKETIRNKYGYSLQYYLRAHQLPVPTDWKSEQLDAFNQACFGNAPAIIQQRSDLQNKDGFTVAMILACQNLPIPTIWYHDPIITNEYGYTVALYIARFGNIPPTEWSHNKHVRAEFQFYFDLREQRVRYLTVKNFLAQHQRNAPKDWDYELIYSVDQYENTEAMRYAQIGIVPPQQLYHHPLITNIFDETVALILCKQGVLPPREWAYNMSYVNKMGTSLLDTLQKKGFSYDGKHFTLHYQQYRTHGECVRCHEIGTMNFVKSKCGHLVCAECFEYMVQFSRNKLCPKCRMSDWYYLEEQEKETVNGCILQLLCQ